MKRTGLSVIAIAFTTSLSLLAACEKAETPLPKTETPEVPAPQAKQGGANDAATVTQTERDTTLQMARKEIDQLKAQVDALSVKAKDAGAALKDQLTTDIQGFEQDLKELETKFSALKDASATVWQDMKASFSASADKLKESVEKDKQPSKATGSSY